MRRLICFSRRTTFLFLLITALAGFIAPAIAKTNIVVMHDRTFDPADLTINVGDTVIWQVGDGAHTITKEMGVSEPFCGSALYDGSTPPCVATFGKVGDFAYYCQAHLAFAMRGIIRVIAAPNNVPPTVSLVYPVANSSIASKGTNVFTATASDTDGIITRLEFIFGFTPTAITNSIGIVTNTIGTNTIFTLETSTNTLEIGTRISLLAKATDDRGAESFSDVIAVFAGPVLDLTLVTDNIFQFHVPATNMLKFILQTSTNLTNWASLYTNTVSTNGLIFTNDAPTTNTFRFYRVKLQP